MRAKLIIILVLVAATVGVFWQALGCQFVNFDDASYVTDNPFIRSGFTRKSITWAFTRFYAYNWHPLTWLSHMADVRLFGLAPAGHHLTSILLHAANVVLLFLFLSRATGALRRSAVVALLFALHPLHVESVVWVAERKDVLSTFFGFLTLYLYAGYAASRRPGTYLAALFFFTLGLLSKPMLVTLPLVMLLLDYWPLGRLDLGQHREGADVTPGPRRERLTRLVLEKLPFLALAAVSCVVTSYAQKGEMIALEVSPISTRVANALLVYLQYLGKMFWPRNLAVFYPYPDAIPLWQSAGAALLLVGVTLVTLWQRRERPYLLVGWLWYLGTLVPVIGVLRVGLQAMADRYTYLPLIGIFFMLVWYGAEVSSGWAYRRALLFGGTGAVLLACTFLTARQESYWQDRNSLFSHAIEVTRDNYYAYYVLGLALEEKGSYAEAVDKFTKAIEISPIFVNAHYDRGTALYQMGKVDEAIADFNWALAQKPDYIEVYNNLGAALMSKGRYPEAIRSLETFAKANPDLPYAYNNLGLAYLNSGNFEAAARDFNEALRLDPAFTEARRNLEVALKEGKGSGMR